MKTEILKFIGMILIVIGFNIILLFDINIILKTILNILFILSTYVFFKYKFHKKTLNILKSTAISSIEKDMFLYKTFYRKKILKNIGVDLTEVEIKKMVTRFDLLMNKLPFAVIITDKKNRIIDVNKYALDLYGYSYSELMILKYTDLKHNRSNALIHCKKNGKLFPVRLLKKAKVANQFFYLMKDITKEVDYANLMERFKSKYTSIFTLFTTISNCIPQMLWVKDISLRYTFINDRAAKTFFGIDNPDLILGKTEAELLKDIEKTYKHDFTNRGEKSDQIVLMQKNQLHFNDFGYSIGKWLDIDVYKYPMFDDNGDVIGIIGIAEDVTDEVESMNRRKDVYKIAKIGEWYNDVLADKVEWSDGLYSIYEIDESIEDLDNYYVDAVHPDDIDIHKKYKQDLYNNKEAYAEYRIMANGKLKHTLVKAKAVTDNNDSIISFYGIQQDITDLKLTQEELELSKIQIDKRNKELEESNEILENFAYTTSHDLKTPLRGINSFLDKLLRKLDADGSIKDEKIEQYITFIKKSAKQMNSIVIDTLNYAKISKNDLHLTENNVLSCVNDAMPFGYNKEDSNVNITISIDPDLVIKSDKIQLIRIFQNFITNAIKFNSKDLKEIKIGYNKVGGYLCVQDNGDGIDEEHYDKIFNLFQRLHGSKVDGNGLGLAIVKRIIQRHNWKLQVQSEIGKGSIFKIYI